MPFRKQLQETLKEYLPLILILGFALFLRTYNLLQLPIFADESIYVRWAQIVKNEPSLRFISLSDGKQPLFMWILWPLLSAFQNPLYAGRMLSAISGLGSILGVYLLAQELFKSRRISIVSSLIYAVMPFSIFFERMALVDALLSFFGVWTFLFVIKAVEGKRFDYSLLAGFALAGAALTKSPALIIASMLPLVIFLTGKMNLNNIFRKFLYIVPAWVVGFVGYNIQRLGPNFHLLASRTGDYVYPYSHLLESPLNPLLPHLGAVLDYFAKLGPLFLLLVFGLGIYLSIKLKSRERIFLALIATLPVIAVCSVSKTMTARYIFFILPFITVMVASVFDLLKNERVFYLVVVVLILQSLLIDNQIITSVEAANLPRSERSGYLEQWTAGVGLKEVSDYLVAEHLSNPQEKLLVGSEGYFGTPLNALELYLQNYPEITVVGVGVNLTDLPPQLVDSRLSGNKTYLVINSTRLNMDPAKHGLVKIAEYPKPENPQGQQEVLYLFEVE